MRSKIDRGLLNLNCSISLPITMAGGFETRPYIPIVILPLAGQIPNLHPVESLSHT